MPSQADDTELLAQLHSTLQKLVAASQRPDFPSGPERSLLETALQQVSDVLDRKPQEKTANGAGKTVSEAEQQYRSVFESTSDAILIFDYEGKLIEVNPAACRMHGYSYEEMVGLSGATIVHPDDHHKFADFVQQVAAGQPFQVESTHVRKDGEPVAIKVTGTSFVFAGRDALLAVVRDMSEEKKALEALRENEQRLKFVMESMPQKIFTATPEGDVDYFNSNWMEFTGLSFEEIKSWGWTQFIHPDDVDENIKTWTQSIETGEPFKFQHRFRRADGKYRWHLSRALPMRNDQGEITKWIGANSEIHEVKNLQDELRSVAANLSEANRRKTEFLATLSHELRNPLAPIRTGLELLKMIGNDPSKMEETRSMMERQTRQLVRLIDDLLDISRVTQDKLELRPSTVQLADVVQSAVEASQPLIEELDRNLELSVPDEPILLKADPSRLAQVISNLLNNAAKYTSDEGQIWLTVSREADQVVISVRDNGLGIPKEMQALIFDMFSQIDRPSEPGLKGLGIGLTLVKQLVDMHGGEIEVHSEGQGTGSEFIVRLPVLGGEDSAPETESDDAEASTEGLRILVVDDNKAAADMLATVTRMLGHELRTAYDGEQATEVAAEFRPDVILMDIGMPKMDGCEAARYIRARDWGKEIVLVALTGWGQEEDRQRTQDAGFDHHLVKPAEPATLKEIFAEIAKRSD